MNEAFETKLRKITKGVNSMTKKVITLESLEGLVTKRTMEYLMSNFKSLDEIIWHGRLVAYLQSCKPDSVKKIRKSTRELISVLDNAGYIRHDINSESFCLGRLYRIVYRNEIDAVMMPDNINDFCETIERTIDGKITYRVDYHMGNKKYESFKNPTDEQIDAVRQSLKTHLNWKEYEILAYMVGFDGGNPHEFRETCEHFNVSYRYVYDIEKKILGKLPTLSSPSDKERMEVVSIIKELEEIRKDPIFKRNTELIEKLSKISKMPFDCAEMAAKYLSGDMLDCTSISELNLNYRIYSCLMGEGICTINDIIKRPKEDWPKVRNLGPCAIREIEEKVRKAGYADFSIRILS